MAAKNAVPTRWDSKIFGFPTYELKSASAAALREASRLTGHITVRIPPLAPVNPLLRHGFYYADTLVIPGCARKDFVPHNSSHASLDDACAIDDLLAISRNAFVYGRFHRDPNIARAKAEARYAQWLRQLHGEKKVLGLLYKNDLAGFIAHEKEKLVLHAVAPKFRGKGLSKFLWSCACKQLFLSHPILTSSVSAANLPAVNLYASLGFRFNEAVDVYHRFNRPS